AIFALASATGFPIASEATSQLRFAEAPTGVTIFDALDPAYRSPRFRDCADPDLVLHIGKPVVSTGWERRMATSTATHVVLADHGWNDPHSKASRLLFAPPAKSARAIVSGLASKRAATPTAWQTLIQRANAIAWSAIDADLASHAETCSEGSIARAVASSVADGQLLMVGNSLAVRHLDTFCKQGSSRATVLSQRGASGIDGLVASAAGSASKQGAPLTLLLGDVSLLHDLTSLRLARSLEVPLVVVVIQNYGGRIFEHLPIASAQGIEPEIMHLTTTPHDIDLSHAARLFGARWARVTKPHELVTALEEAHRHPGCTLVEAIVDEHGSAEQSRRIARVIDKEMERELARVT
ncbi:MAG: thiamine pyrophosphate-dependent enzyme, partial [Polyangiaceae bacterium]